MENEEILDFQNDEGYESYDTDYEDTLEEILGETEVSTTVGDSASYILVSTDSYNLEDIHNDLVNLTFCVCICIGVVLITFLKRL